jgi:hypothetical protein
MSEMFVRKGKGPNADHFHGIAPLNELGNGVTEEAEGHHHSIIGYQVEGAGKGKHIHPLEKVITMRPEPVGLHG